MDVKNSAAKPVVRPLPITPTKAARDRDGVLSPQLPMHTLRELRNTVGANAGTAASHDSSLSSLRNATAIAPVLKGVGNCGAQNAEGAAYAAAVEGRLHQSCAGLGQFGILDEAGKVERDVHGPRGQAFLAGLARAANRVER